MYFAKILRNIIIQWKIAQNISIDTKIKLLKKQNISIYDNSVTLMKNWVAKINQEIILTTCHEKARRGLSQEAQKLALVMSTETTCSPE